MWTVKVLLLSSIVFSYSGWEKRLPSSGIYEFSPRVIFLKVGVFSKRGLLKKLFSDLEIKQACSSEFLLQGWVTHRLSQNDTLSIESGKKLGKSLSQLSDSSSLKAFELDIEPMHSIPKWLNGFLSGLKNECPHIEIRLATPPLFKKPISGIAWNEELDTILSVLDGVDFMLYDSGINDFKTYEDLIIHNISEIKRALKKWPNKKFYLGLPAYKDKTKLHNLKIENLNVIKRILFSLPDELKKFLCIKNIDFSYYSLWTIDKNDISEIKLIEEWRKKECQN